MELQGMPGLSGSDGGAGSEAIKTGAWLESLAVARAASLARRGRLEEATHLLLPLANSEADGTGALDLLAKIRAQQNRLPEAIVLWEQALQLDPHNPKFTQAIALCRSGSTNRYGFYLGGRMLAGIALAALLTVLAISNLQTHQALNAVRSELAAKTEAVPVAGPGAKADLELKGKVAALLQDNAYSTVQQAVVDENSGTISISGTVPNLLLRYKLEQAVRKIPGVQGLDVSGLKTPATYQVRSGDSLYAISRGIYGTPERWQEIADKNHVPSPYVVYTGQLLQLPE